MKYFPEIPEEVLHHQWERDFRHVEPDYKKWLKFMHDMRKGGGDLPGPKLWHVVVPIVFMLACAVGAMFWLAFNS